MAKTRENRATLFRMQGRNSCQLDKSATPTPEVDNWGGGIRLQVNAARGKMSGRSVEAECEIVWL